MYASDMDAIWRKSTHSDHQGECVEVADLTDKIGVRDSKQLNPIPLWFSREAMRALLDQIKDGDLDL